MAFEFKSESFRVELAQDTPLEQVLRQRHPGASWSAIRRLVSTGKVSIDSSGSTEPRQLVAPGAQVSIRMTAPKPRPGQVDSDMVLHCDAHVIVVRKPVGISSVEHEDEPTSLQALLRDWLARHERRSCPLPRVVHRLDKVTSGVMIFARNAAAQQHLKEQFRAHTTGRYYIAVAHGAVQAATLSFRLVRDRGDGLRGVTEDPNRGRHSVTHFSVEEQLARCTVLRCQLETGRTHQIRIHLAHIGHPMRVPRWTRRERFCMPLSSASCTRRSAGGSASKSPCQQTSRASSSANERFGPRPRLDPERFPARRADCASFVMGSGPSRI
jgi:23S rRNA pseudouridine1911/1915/1917 synthase